MLNVDTGGADRLALAVVAQYRMATTEQMHLIIAPEVRIEQTRRRLAKLREEGLVDRITLPRAGRTRVWFATQYGVEVASEWPELRGVAAAAPDVGSHRRPSAGGSRPDGDGDRPCVPAGRTAAR